MAAFSRKRKINGGDDQYWNQESVVCSARVETTPPSGRSKPCHPLGGVLVGVGVGGGEDRMLQINPLIDTGWKPREDYGTLNPGTNGKQGMEKKKEKKTLQLPFLLLGTD